MPPEVRRRGPPWRRRSSSSKQVARGVAALTDARGYAEASQCRAGEHDMGERGCELLLDVVDAIEVSRLVLRKRPRPPRDANLLGISSELTRGLDLGEQTAHQHLVV